MMTPETRIYIYPSFSKPVQYIELIECHAPSEWFTFSESQSFAVLNDEKKGVSVEISPGSYSLKSLESIFNKNLDKTGIKIANDGTVRYLYSGEYQNATLTNDLAISLGAPEKLTRYRSYRVQVPPKKLVKVYCDLIEEDSSYENNYVDSSSIKLTRSQLLAVVPSQRYDRLRISQTKNPINYFTVTILDENGNRLKLIDEPIRIQLKLSF